MVWSVNYKFTHSLLRVLFAVLSIVSYGVRDPMGVEP